MVMMMILFRPFSSSNLHQKMLIRCSHRAVHARQSVQCWISVCCWQLVDLAVVENLGRRLLQAITVATKMRWHRISNLYGWQRSVLVSALALINMFETVFLLFANNGQLKKGAWLTFCHWPPTWMSKSQQLKALQVSEQFLNGTTIKPNISNKAKNILDIDRVE